MTQVPRSDGPAVEPLDTEIDRLRGLALRDDLTGVFNRRAFLERLHQAVAEAASDGPIASLVLLDLDGLKDINDTLGYQAGDRALREFGLALAGAVRAQDMVARIGGDEFAVVARHGSPEEAAAFADRLRDLARGILRTLRPHGPAVILSAALGQGVWGVGNPTVESIFAAAEAEMAAAKAATPPMRTVDGAFRPRGRRALSEELCSLLAMARYVNTAGNMAIVLRRATEQAAALIGAQIAGIFLGTDAGQLSGDEIYRNGVWEPCLEHRPIGRGVIGRTASMGLPEVHNTLTPDLVADPTVITRYGLRSMLCVPLHDRHGGMLGVLVLCNKRGGQDFQEIDVGLTQAYADLAASAIENARDYAAMEQARAELAAAEAETRRRNRELEARNEVAAILTGSQPAPAALRDVLPIIARVVAVEGALVMLTDDAGRLCVAAGHGVPQPASEALAATPPPPVEQALDAAAGRTPVILADLAEAPAAPWQALYASGFRSFAMLPLVADERAVGLLAAGSVAAHTFDDARIAPLRAFADQIAVWLDGRRLLEQATQSADDARFLADIGEALNETLDEAEILRRLVTGMAAKFAGGILVMTRDVAAGVWRPAATAHPDPRRHAAIRAALRNWQWSEQNVPRDLVEQRFSPKLIKPLTDTLPENERWVQASRAMGIHTMLVAPLAAGGQLLGVLAAGSYGRRPALTARHLDLAQEVAQHAAVAIVNARALQDAKQSRAFLRAMMEQTGDAIMVLDAAADRILDANAAAERLTGRTRAELLRCGMRDLVGVRGLQPWRRAVANLGDAETGTERAVLRLRAADLTVTVEAVASRVATPTGTVVMAVLRHSAP